MSSLKWIKHKEQVVAVRPREGRLNVRRIASKFRLDVNTVEFNGVVETCGLDGFTTEAIAGGQDQRSAIVVTGKPAGGPVDLVAALSEGLKEANKQLVTNFKEVCQVFVTEVEAILAAADDEALPCLATKADRPALPARLPTCSGQDREATHGEVMMRGRLAGAKRRRPDGLGEACSKGTVKTADVLSRPGSAHAHGDAAATQVSQAQPAQPEWELPSTAATTAAPAVTAAYLPAHTWLPPAQAEAPQTYLLRSHALQTAPPVGFNHT